MKQLTCELCGGTNFAKQDGAFVCQDCGCKYSLEEARKIMMGDSTEIAAPAAPAVNSKLENLYTLARRAKKDRDDEKAAEYYSAIALEDPNSWEAAFYSVYYKVMSCRIAQIENMGYKIAYSLDSVMKLIRDNVPEEAQKAAYTEVVTATIKVATMLFNASISTFEKASHSDASKDLNARIAAALTAYCSAGLAVHGVFDDIMMAKTIYEGSIKLCNSHYKTKIYAQVSQGKLNELKPRLDAIQKEKNDRFWAEHPELKADLEAEKADLERKIADLERQIDNIPGQEEIGQIRSQINSLTQQKDSLGIFKGKEKRALQEQIDALTPRIGNIQRRMEADKAALEAQIKPLQETLDTVAGELTKAR